MKVFSLDPCADGRWRAFVEGRPDASLFHLPGWMAALRKTYGYEPFVLTTSPPDAPLTDGIPFCRVNSLITGRRLVSLPFADHCQPLVDDVESYRALLQEVREISGRERRKYVEIRCVESPDFGEEAGRFFGQSDDAYLHSIDLEPSLDELASGLHSSSISRKIRRSARENLIYAEGVTTSLLEDFYRLLIMTRRMHRIPPQPKQWFQNLLDLLEDHILIRIAYKEESPVAAIMTGHFGSTHVYKYGCSDPAYRNLGGTPMIMWRAISDAKTQGARWFDLGRTDRDNEGLIVFKERFGAQRSELEYYRSPPPRKASGRFRAAQMNAGGRVVARLPDALLVAAGKLMYPHIG